MHEIGINNNTTVRTPIEVTQSDRFQHTYVVGQTGTGKSTFAKHSFLQDVAAGFGGCFMDFHGQDAPWLLDHIPAHRIDDVIYFNPLDAEHCLGYNVLDGIRTADTATFTDEIVASLRHIFHASWGARMDDILVNAVRPLFDLPPESQGTMLGVVRMLNDPFYRNWVVKQTREQTVRDFWLSEYAGWSKNDRAHNLNSSLNKIRRFQSSPILRNVLGQQRSRINFARLIADGQLLILDFNKWRMGADNANLLASLVLSRLIYEGTRRATGIGVPVIPFHVYVDEFQSVTTQSMVDALSGIRKYQIGFTLAHQYTHQLPRPIMDAIKGNVGTKIVFRVGGEDAEELQRSLDVTNAKELTELSDYNFIAQYKNGHSVSTRRGRSEPLAWKKHGLGRSIIARMHGKFARPRAEVEATYERWRASRHYGGVVNQPAAKKEPGQGRAAAVFKKQGGLRSLSHILRG